MFYSLVDMIQNFKNLQQPTMSHQMMRFGKTSKHHKRILFYYDQNYNGIRTEGLLKFSQIFNPNSIKKDFMKINLAMIQVIILIN